MTDPKMYTDAVEGINELFSIKERYLKDLTAFYEKYGIDRTNVGFDLGDTFKYLDEKDRIEKSDLSEREKKVSMDKIRDAAKIITDEIYSKRHEVERLQIDVRNLKL